MKLGQVFDNAREASKQAFGKWDEMTSRPTDPELRGYTRLSEPDFEELVGRFGVDATTAYVASMEKRLADWRDKHG